MNYLSDSANHISESVLWWGWGDARQNRAINSLAEQTQSRHNRMARAASRSNRQLQERITNEISGVQGRFDEVLEIIELRFQLAEYDEYQVRTNARKTFRALAAQTDPVSSEFHDVDGYWMPPAALAMRDLIQGTGIDMQENLDRARERDRLRTELLALSVGVCFEQPLLQPPAISHLLALDPALESDGEPTEEGISQEAGPRQVVSNGWRQLWKQCARGDFGAAAYQQLQTRLRELVEAEPATLSSAQLRTWTDAIRALAPTSATGAEGVGATIDSLYEHVKDSLKEVPAIPTPAEGLQSDDLEQWRHFLQELIEEPSAAERPLLEALRSLRSGYTAGGDDPTWKQPAGGLPDLFLHDIVADGVAPAQRAIALRLAAPWLLQTVDAIFHGAAANSKLSRELRHRALRVTVSSDGADPVELEKLERRIASWARPEIPSSSSQAAIVAVCLAVAFLFFTCDQAVLGVLSLLGLAIPFWRHRQAIATAEDERLTYEQMFAELQREIAATKIALADEERAQERASQQVKHSASRLRNVLSGSTMRSGESGSL
ncbi:hypothetical protein [Natronoglycomyces albus]|uniref:Uncharacterized protein n=1 Tax=Natronoglycomyces albus TaxID=2811108 RepID=A0A895XSB8_9ACTN|nr:hypothetical protein [Natronoglycomyces albus]QSB06403.1 hypothetical protein JQS30_05730 [Natronoglycomyces albus]